MAWAGCRTFGSPCLEAETKEVFSFYWIVLSGFKGNVLSLTDRCVFFHRRLHHHLSFWRFKTELPKFDFACLLT